MSELQEGSVCICTATAISDLGPSGGRAPSQSAFAGAGVFKPCVEGIKDKIQEDAAEKQAEKDADQKKRLCTIDEEEAEERVTEASGSGEMSSEPGNRGMKAKHFDETCIYRAKRLQDAKHLKLAEALEKNEKAGIEALAEVAALPAALSQHCELEKNTLEYRLTFVRAVRSASPEAKKNLAALILDTKIKRPPAEDYEHLEPLIELEKGQEEAFMELLASANSQDDVQWTEENLDILRAPHHKLIRSVDKACVDMLKKRKRYAEQKACHLDARRAAKRSRVADARDFFVAVPQVTNSDWSNRSHLLGGQWSNQAVKPIFALDELEALPSKSNAAVLEEADLDLPFVMHIPDVSEKLQAGPWVLLLLCPLLFVVVVVAEEVTVDSNCCRFRFVGLKAGCVYLKASWISKPAS
jgi:hypothetical protein